MERRLDPPKALLQWLVEHAKAPLSKGLWGSAETKAKRERLVAGDPDTVAEALHLLEGSRKARGWYVLEGRSQPDACFETESLILVIEGKRTEREATASTTWMPQRSQMLRHMDAAMEVCNGKRVLGLMITEGEGGADATAPSEYWLGQAELQAHADTLGVSLPHRNPAERQEIADGFLGATTWQRVCADFGLPWPPVEDAGGQESGGSQDPYSDSEGSASSNWKTRKGMRRSELSVGDFPKRRRIQGFEGGAVYVAEREGKSYVIEDESTFAGLLSEEDLEGIELVRIYEFDTEEDRNRYLRDRGW